MGLKNDVDLAEIALASCGQSSPNLSGMVAVIIDYADSAGFAAQLETPVDTAEAFERGANLLGWDAETGAHRDCRRGIQHIVRARNVKAEFAKILAALDYPK